MSQENNTSNINLPADKWLTGYWLQGSEKIQFNSNGNGYYLNYSWPDCTPTSCDVQFMVDYKGRVTHCRKAMPGELRQYEQAEKPQRENTYTAVTHISEQPRADMVNHPPHYNQPGQPEVWEQMVAIYGRSAYINFARLSAFKYRMRAGHKADAAEDIAKAMWYENKIKELTKNQ